MQTTLILLGLGWVRLGYVMLILTCAWERGADSALPSCFCSYLVKYLFDRHDFFSTCLKINGAPFGAKMKTHRFCGVYF